MFKSVALYCFYDSELKKKRVNNDGEAKQTLKEKDSGLLRAQQIQNVPKHVARAPNSKAVEVSNY